ncbi:MAG: MlaD family protein [Chitinophagales bacterium]
MKLSDEFKVGVLATFGLVVAIFGYSYVKGYSFFSEPRYFYGVYQKVDGLNPSDPILINGYKVGKVQSIQLKDLKSAQILVSIRINEDVDIPENSTADIISSDLLGEKAIQINMGNSEVLAKSGDTLMTSTAKSLTQEVSDQMLPVKLKAEELFSSIDSLVTIVGFVLQESNIQKSFQSIEKATSQFEQVAINIDTLVVSQTKTISNILSNIENITANLDSSDEEITALIYNLSAVTDSLSKANLGQMVNNLSKSLGHMAQVLDSVNQGQGSVSALINEREFYDNLNRTVTDLDSLLVDVKENPGNYVHLSLFGGGGKKKRSKK